MSKPSALELAWLRTLHEKLSSGEIPSSVARQKNSTIPSVGSGLPQASHKATYSDWHPDYLRSNCLGQAGV